MAKTLAVPAIVRTIEGLDEFTAELRQIAAKEGRELKNDGKLTITQVGWKQYTRSLDLAAEPPSPEEARGRMERIVAKLQGTASAIEGRELPLVEAHSFNPRSAASDSGVIVSLLDVLVGPGEGGFLLHNDRNEVRQALGLQSEATPTEPAMRLLHPLLVGGRFSSEAIETAVAGLNSQIDGGGLTVSVGALAVGTVYVNAL